LIVCGEKSIIETLKELPKDPETYFLDYDGIMLTSELFKEIRRSQPEWFKKWLVEHYDENNIKKCINWFDDTVSLLLEEIELDGDYEKVLYNLYCEYYEFI